MKKTCPEHNATPVRTARIQNNVDHGALRRRYYGTMRASRSCDFMPRGIVAGEIQRRLAHALAPIGLGRLSVYRAALLHVGRPFSWAINEQAPLRLRCEPTYPPFLERRYFPAVLSQKS